MTVEKRVCDKCGKDLTNLRVFSHRYYLTSVYDVLPPLISLSDKKVRDYDLCSDCEKEFFKLLFEFFGNRAY